MTTRKIVHRVEDGDDRRGILCTTYQMRNFYRQLGDGFFTGLDVMNYVQHHWLASRVRPGQRLLDVCCGRGLLLPLLRYGRKDLGCYVGVDIEPANAAFLRGRVTDGKPVDPAGYYPFPVEFVEANVARMSSAPALAGREFDVLAYTSSIEHMHPDDGRASLAECRALGAPGAAMYLTSPNTPEGRDGYETRYRAHVYEWKRDELREALAGAGWEVVAEWGLAIGKRELLEAAEPLGLRPLVERLAKFVPPEWLLPVLAPMFPAEAKEVGFVCRVA